MQFEKETICPVEGVGTSVPAYAAACKQRPCTANKRSNINSQTLATASPLPFGFVASFITAWPSSDQEYGKLTGRSAALEILDALILLLHSSGLGLDPD